MVSLLDDAGCLPNDVVDVVQAVQGVGAVGEEVGDLGDFRLYVDEVGVNLVDCSHRFLDQFGFNFFDFVDVVQLVLGLKGQSNLLLEVLLDLVDGIVLLPVLLGTGRTGDLVPDDAEGVNAALSPVALIVVHELGDGCVGQGDPGADFSDDAVSQAHDSLVDGVFSHEYLVLPLDGGEAGDHVLEIHLPGDDVEAFLVVQGASVIGGWAVRSAGELEEE